MEKILVIEDEPVVRAHIATILRGEGYEVCCADNGSAGIQQLEESEPDLVLCETDIAGINSQDILKRLRNDSNAASIPFIFISGDAKAEKFRERMNLGADDCLTKPVDKQDLLQSVRSRFKRIKMVEENIHSKLRNIKHNISSVYSHEFNTPLNGIIGFTDLLLEYHQEHMSDEMAEMVKAIKVSTQRLNRITDNLILFADLQRYDESEGVSEVYKTGATQKYAESLPKDMLRIPQFYKRGEDVHFNLEEGRLRIAYKDLVKILTEAPDNALKYSQKGSPVRVKSAIDGNFIHFSVSDEGIGMKSSNLNDYDSFQNLDRARKLKFGIGLGLYFIKELTRLNKGYAEIEAENGVGTTIHIYLPRDHEKRVGY